MVAVPESLTPIAQSLPNHARFLGRGMRALPLRRF